MIKPYKRYPSVDVTVVGFDTEYDSKTGELLSVQLWSGATGSYTPWPRGKRLTPADLIRMVKAVAGDAENYFVVSYFSLAELQFLRIRDAFEVREYANGSLDVTFADENCNMVIFDLARFFERRSLKDVAGFFGYEKKEWPTRKVTRADLSKPGFDVYALHDAKIAFLIFCDLREKFLSHGVDIAVYRTPAGASASVFRCKYVKEEIGCDSMGARKAALQGCWGGRAEAFFRGSKPNVVECDIRAAYPTSAIALKVFPSYGDWVSLSALSKMDKYKGGFATVAFNAKKDRYPCLPVFVSDSLVYPTRGVSSCTFEELKVARERGYNLELLTGYGYRTGTSIVADYMRWTLLEREKATGAGSYLFKLLGNSLTGKFWQRTDKASIDEIMKAAEDNGIPFDELLAMRPEEQSAFGVQKTVSVGTVFMPEWAGLTTGYTRAMLARMISEGEAIYAHTDSVWVPQSRLSRLHRLDLGGLEWSIKGEGNAVVVRTRFAELSGREYHHVPHHSVWNVKAAENAISKFKGEDFTFRYPIRRPLKLREASKRKIPVGTWVTEWRTGNTVWCGKRQVENDGTTHPWETADDFAQSKKRLRATEIPAHIDAWEGDQE